ncbi:hypothetical protein B0H17DRAFT_1126454 [Mycena rosella]|uniref:Uncharacterized protein n=1 Tax=Mycena rosella TaxID=1033263 RepID=A0AAD7M7G2_MYCRO|nr:hypothetical protein B0H17DRAFT_1126454 [Mycena rosella]
MLRSRQLAAHRKQADQWAEVAATLVFLGVHAAARHNVEEILDGIAGDRADLAGLLVKEMDLIVEHTGSLAGLSTVIVNLAEMPGGNELHFLEDFLEKIIPGTYTSSKACENMKCLKIAEKGSKAAPCATSRAIAHGTAGRATGTPATENGGKLGTATPATARFCVRCCSSTSAPSTRRAHPAVLIQQAKFIYENPRTEFSTAFDLTQLGDGLSRIDVHPMVEYTHTPGALLRLAQLARSRGRMQLDAVIMNGGPAPLLRIPTYTLDSGVSPNPIPPILRYSSIFCLIFTGSVVPSTLIFGLLSPHAFVYGLEGHIAPPNRRPHTNCGYIPFSTAGLRRPFLTSRSYLSPRTALRGPHTSRPASAYSELLVTPQCGPIPNAVRAQERPGCRPLHGACIAPVAHAQRPGSPVRRCEGLRAAERMLLQKRAAATAPASAPCTAARCCGQTGLCCSVQKRAAALPPASGEPYSRALPKDSGPSGPVI